MYDHVRVWFIELFLTILLGTVSAMLKLSKYVINSTLFHRTARNILQHGVRP